jgi:hypothetical protein
MTRNPESGLLAHIDVARQERAGTELPPEIPLMQSSGT